MSDLDAEKIVEKAVSYALPSVTKITLALCEQAMAKGIDKCVDTMRALADDIISGRAPVSDLKEAADYLAKIADDKRREARKILHPN